MFRKYLFSDYGTNGCVRVAQLISKPEDRGLN